MNVGIIYGSSTGSTAAAAGKIAEQFDDVVKLPVNRISGGEFTSFDLLILGSSTWGLGDLQGDWKTALSALQVSNLAGKKVALFGCGDQLAFADTFVDAIGTLAQAVEAAGGQLVGLWPTAGYDFSASTAVREGNFCGLPLDEENQAGLSAERIVAWCRQLQSEAA